MKTYIGTALAILAVALGSRSFAAEDHLSDQQKLGRRLFEQSCGVCHTRPTLVSGMYGPELSSFNLGGRDDLCTFISNGTARMPGFKYTYDPEQIAAIAAYIKTLPPGIRISPRPGRRHARQLRLSRTFRRSPMKQLRLMIIGTLLIASMEAGVAWGDSRRRGAVSSAGGEKMGGVTVSAKADGSTITTSVYTDDTGNYYFPPLPEASTALGAGGQVRDGLGSANLDKNSPARISRSSRSRTRKTGSAASRR